MPRARRLKGLSRGGIGNGCFDGTSDGAGGACRFGVGPVARVLKREEGTRGLCARHSPRLRAMGARRPCGGGHGAAAHPPPRPWHWAPDPWRCVGDRVDTGRAPPNVTVVSWGRGLVGRKKSLCGARGRVLVRVSVCLGGNWGGGGGCDLRGGAACVSHCSQLQGNATGGRGTGVRGREGGGVPVDHNVNRPRGDRFAVTLSWAFPRNAFGTALYGYGDSAPDAASDPGKAGDAATSTSVLRGGLPGLAAWGRTRMYAEPGELLGGGRRPAMLIAGV